ncbi:MAG TPA: hypothetical protein VK547_09685 [Candidatus Udaeobacter sp.]|nr:hypothetical protein [Candidatus Udaeobacter sp.]
MTDDHRHWANARTLNDLGNLTARWLEGDITHLPAYFGTAPATETTPLITRLAAYNRAGLVTTCSQPGEPFADGCGQRAWVSGFCDEETVDKIRAACLDTDLIAIYTPPGGDNHTQIAVTIDDYAEYTWAGGTSSPEDIDYYYGTDCPHALPAIKAAWRIDVIDPQWGRTDLLWDRLALALA